jgi:thiamine pyrophosphokinase
MKTERIRANVAVTLVGAGRVGDAALDAALGFGRRLFAADGGAHRLQRHGLLPEAVIGDLDSLGPEAPWLAAGVAVHRIAEQDSTDFEKCLRLIEAPLYLALGLSGDRLDHFLAALSVLAAMPERRAILIGEDDFLFLAPEALELDLPRGTRISLWPIADTRVTRSEGLVWPAAGLVLSPTGRTGTSNQTAGGTVRLGFERRGVFVILPLAALGEAVRVLAARIIGRPI